VKLACFVFIAACTFNPQTGLQSDGSSADASRLDARTDSRTADAPASDAPNSTCPSGYVHLGALASQYKVYGWTSGDRGRNFANAQQACASPRTHLAIIDSADEAKELWAAIALNPRSPYFWEGVTDTAAEGTWRTVLGTSPAWLPWASGQPSGGTAANCALANRDNIYDWFCGSRYPFACECE